MYKYKSNDYPYMAQEIGDFYKALELYKNNPTKENKWDLNTSLKDLYFILKFFLNSGHLSPTQFEEMVDYFKGVAYEACLK